MRFQLTISEGKDSGRSFVFDQEAVVIGRTSDCDVILYQPGVSRRHARIFLDGERYYVEDMGSSNGTRVNGATITKQPLADGDTLSLGPVAFEFLGLGDELADGAGEPPPEAVAGQDTRILPADQIKPRSPPQKVAMLAASVGPEERKQIEQKRTVSMPAVGGGARRASDRALPSVAESRENDGALPEALGRTRSDRALAASRRKRSDSALPEVAAAEGGPSGLARRSSGRVRKVEEEDPEAAIDAELAPPRPVRPRRGSDRLAEKPRRSPSGKLSAADRARLRRSSPAGKLKVGWMEAGGNVRKIILGVAVLGVAALAFAGVRYAPALFEEGPKADEPAVLYANPLPASFGLGEGVDWPQPDMKVFNFDFSAPVDAVVILHFQSRDVSENEVSISVNGTDVGTVPADTLMANEKAHEVIVPAAVVRKGEPNQVIFDNVRNPPGDETWRIWNTRVEIALLPELPRDALLREAQAAFQRGRQAFDRREIGAGNRYEAWKEYRNAWLLLEGHPEPKPELYLLARAKVKESQQELDRTCAKLLLEVERAYNQRDWPEARSTLTHVAKYFPEYDQACRWRAERKAAEYGL